VNLRPNKAFLVTALCRGTEINGISNKRGLHRGHHQNIRETLGSAIVKQFGSCLALLDIAG